MIHKIKHDIPGYMPWQQIYRILTEVKKRPGPINILEMGSLFGNLTVQLNLNTTDDDKIYTIDNWGSIPVTILTSMHKFLYDSGEMDAVEVLEEITKTTNGQEHLDGVTFHNWWKHFTKDCNNVIDYKSFTTAVDCSDFPMFDIVIQDAAHDYDGVMAECQMWWPKLKQGGFWIADDYHSGNWPDCKRALDEFFNQQQVTAIEKREDLGYICIVK